MNEKINEFLLETDFIKKHGLVDTTIDKRIEEIIENSYEFKRWELRKRTKKLILSISKAIGLKA